MRGALTAGGGDGAGKLAAQAVSSSVGSSSVSLSGGDLFSCLIGDPLFFGFAPILIGASLCLGQPGALGVLRPLARQRGARGGRANGGVLDAHLLHADGGHKCASDGDLRPRNQHAGTVEGVKYSIASALRRRVNPGSTLPPALFQSAKASAAASGWPALCSRSTVDRAKPARPML